MVKKKNWKEAWLTNKDFEKKFKIKENEKTDSYHQFKAVQVSYFKTEGLKEDEKHRVNDNGIVFYYQGGYANKKG